AFEFAARLRLESRDRHEAAQVQPRLVEHGRDEVLELGGEDAPAGGIVGEVDLDEDVEVAPRPDERVEERPTVERVDRARMRDDAGGLLRLELADEVPREPEVAELLGLRG